MDWLTFLKWFKEFNDSYSSGIIAIAAVAGAIMGWIYKNIYLESKREEGDAAYIVKPTFWTLWGKKYKILAVHKFLKDDKDRSGYKHPSQNSRPDQWQKLVRIKSSCLNHRFKVEPINKNDILQVIISRNGKEKWRSIFFNR